MNTNSTSYNDTTSGTYYCNVIYNSPYYNAYKYNTTKLYEDLLNSIDNVKDKNVLMNHLPSDVNFAIKFFSGYLTDEELQEKQTEGRFWDIIETTLYILVDNETLVTVDTKRNVKVSERGATDLPFNLQGRYYDEC